MPYALGRFACEDCNYAPTVLYPVVICLLPTSNCICPIISLDFDFCPVAHHWLLRRTDQQTCSLTLPPSEGEQFLCHIIGPNPLFHHGDNAYTL